MLTLALLLSLLQATAPAAPASQAAPALPGSTSAVTLPSDNPAVTALALKIYQQMRQGKVDPALLTAEMAAALTPEKLAQVEPIFNQLGDPTRLTLEDHSVSAAGDAYQYLAAFATAQLHVRIMVTPAGKVGGYWVAP